MSGMHRIPGEGEGELSDEQLDKVSGGSGEDAAGEDAGDAADAGGEDAGDAATPPAGPPTAPPPPPTGI